MLPFWPHDWIWVAAHNLCPSEWESTMQYVASPGKRSQFKIRTYYTECILFLHSHKVKKSLSWTVISWGLSVYYMMILKILRSRDFPAGPVVKTSFSSAAGTGSILAGELKSHMLCRMAKKKKYHYHIMWYQNTIFKRRS